MVLFSKRSFSVLLFLGLIFSFAQMQLHAPAGSVIQNQAIAEVENEKYLSNIVETYVLPLCQPSVVPNGSVTQPAQRLSVSPGGRAVLPYLVTNAGNKDFSFDLSWTVSDRSQWIPEEIKLYLDVNQNGTLDAGESEISSIQLGMGEQANVLLAVKAPITASGSAFVNLLAACSDGTKDDDNVSEIVFREGPALLVEKAFSQKDAKVGDSLNVKLYVRNMGDRDTQGEVILSDDLAANPYLKYISGTAYAPKGLIEFFDGSSWSLQEPSNVQAIRLRLANLAIGEEATLEFSLLVENSAPPGPVANTARAEGPGGPAEVTAYVNVLPTFIHYLGPRGNPKAEGVNDRQEKVGMAGQPVCFEHTLLNAGNTSDRYDLEALGVPPGISVVYLNINDAPLPLPLELSPGQAVDFKVCYRLPADGSVPFTVELVARSENSGQTDSTFDAVTKVLQPDQVQLKKEVSPAGTVSAGAKLTYTLSITNQYDFALTNLLITDLLDEHLIYLGSDPNAVYDANKHTLTWRASQLNPGNTWQATVTVQVKKDTPDDTVIENSFYLLSNEITIPVESPSTRTHVWSTAIQISKSVNPSVVRIGDRAHYTIRLFNPGSVDVTLNLTDTPDQGLSYVKGSATPFEPEISNGALIWRNIALAPGEEKVFEYDMRILTGASERLVNVAVAKGESTNGSAVGTGHVHAQVQLSDPVFAERNTTLVGRVFLDFNRNGRFDPKADRPLPGARLVLSNGIQVISDGEGRYAFRDLPAGVWLLKLDPKSAPFDPLPHPEALSDRYTHRVASFGLTTSDFPLAPPEGWIKGYRRTRLVMGPLTVEKELLPLGKDRYRVVLKLSTKEPLPEFELRDPLPSGDVRRFTFDPLIGSKTITYDIEAPAWLTDPEVRWRYP